MNALHPRIEPPKTSNGDFRPLLIRKDLVARKPQPTAPEQSGWSLSMRKRIFDVIVALLLLSALAAPLFLVVVLIRLTSSGPALFTQMRVGVGGKLFRIFKLRTMAVSSASDGIGLTREGDQRITWFGAWLRKMKIDELPQFYNVLRGDMSVVGPRPKLPQYADGVTLAYRPGVTGAASLAFRDEEKLLGKVPRGQVEQFYHQRIKPLKASIDKRYMLQATFASDLRIVLATVLRAPRPHPVEFAHGATEHLQELTKSAVLEMAE